MEPKVIDIQNDPELFKLILDTVPYLPGWKVGDNLTNNAKDADEKGALWHNYPNHTPRFIQIDVGSKTFSWPYEDHDKKGGETLIRHVEQMSKLLDWLYQHTTEK